MVRSSWTEAAPWMSWHGGDQHLESVHWGAQLLVQLKCLLETWCWHWRFICANIDSDQYIILLSLHKTYTHSRYIYIYNYVVIQRYYIFNIIIDLEFIKLCTIFLPSIQQTPQVTTAMVAKTLTRKKQKRKAPMSVRRFRRYQSQSSRTWKPMKTAMEGICSMERRGIQPTTGTSVAQALPRTYLEKQKSV